jgi:CBS domain-containing protein
MAEKNIGALVVLEGEKIVGMISEREYARAIVRGGSAFLDRGINGFWTGHHHDRRNEFHEETQT